MFQTKISEVKISRQVVLCLYDVIIHVYPLIRKACDNISLPVLSRIYVTINHEINLVN